MPRYFRKKSYTNTYHIMIRGINKEEIFKDDLDRQKFLKTLKNSKEKYEYNLYAYCLMNNHVHLLINDFQNKLSKILQSITITYALYFNKKYERVGHLFQNRYKSKCVEKKEYLLNVLRYIHRNPENANICSTKYYKWSSYSEYIKISNIVDTDFILELFDKNKINSKKNFQIFHLSYKKDYEDELEYEFITGFDDETAAKIIKEKYKLKDLTEIANYSIKLRNKFIKELKQINGISKAQISRVLNINRKIIERA